MWCEPAAGSCASGVDTSAYALQALLAAGRAGDADEVADVVAYLVDVCTGTSELLWGGFEVWGAAADDAGAWPDASIGAVAL